MSKVNPSTDDAGGGVVVSGGGLSLLAQIDFANVEDTNFKTGGDGNYTVDGVPVAVGGTLLASELRVADGLLKIGIGQGAINGGVYTPPRFGVWLPPTAQIGPGLDVVALWTLTNDPTNNGLRTVAAMVREAGGAQEQNAGLILQSNATQWQRFARSTMLNIAATDIGSGVLDSPALPGGVGVGLRASGSDLYQGTDHATLSAWSSVGSTRFETQEIRLPWTAPPDPPSTTGLLFDLCWYNENVDVSGLVLECSGVSIWGVAA